MTGKYLISGGCILTLGERTPNLPIGDVLIEDGRITEVGQGIRSRNAEQIDASDCIVMPGFVDSHRHSWRTLFRNIDGHAQRERLLEAQLGPDDIYAAALTGLKSALAAGITTVVDWADPPSPNDALEPLLEAHRDSGARVVSVISSSIDADTIGSAARGENGSLSIAFGGEATTATETAAEWGLAREMGLRIHHHLELDDTRGRVEELDRASLLSDDVTLIHCSGVDDSDLQIIASAGASVVLTPASEMTGGMGSPPIQRLIDNRIRPGLGVDSELAAPGDMFAQMRATNSIQHASMFDLKLSGKASLPQLLTTREVIKYATIDGAGAVGLSNFVGSIEPGKQADILVLRADRPNIHPVNDPIGAVVWGMDTSNVDWVLVAGEPKVRAGELVDGLRRATDLITSSHRKLISTIRTGPEL